MYSCEDNSLKFDEINNDEYEVGITPCSVLGNILCRLFSKSLHLYIIINLGS